MANSQANLNAVFTDTANAIRAKTGETGTIQPIQFADKIASIPTNSKMYQHEISFLVEMGVDSNGNPLQFKVITQIITNDATPFDNFNDYDVLSLISSNKGYAIAIVLDLQDEDHTSNFEGWMRQCWLDFGGGSEFSILMPYGSLNVDENDSTCIDFPYFLMMIGNEVINYGDSSRKSELFNAVVSAGGTVSYYGDNPDHPYKFVGGVVDTVYPYEP